MVRFVAIYDNLRELIGAAKIATLTPEMLVLQQDAVERITDVENPDEAFAYCLYPGADRDDALPFEVIMSREEFSVSHAGMGFAGRYDSFKAEAAAAEAIFMACELFLNGQVRLVLTLGRRRAVAAELFMVVGREAEPVSTEARNVAMQFASQRKLHTHVLQNHALDSRVSIPKNFYGRNTILAKAYESTGRAIDWSEPSPLTAKTWETIIDEITWRSTGKQPKQWPMVFAMKQWETWAFTLGLGAVFIALAYAVPASRGLLQIVSPISFALFVAVILPGLVERKQSRRKPAPSHPTKKSKTTS